MMAEFEEVSAASDVAQAIGSELMRPFAEGGETAARMRDAYYRFVIDTTITGLDALLAARSGSTRKTAKPTDPT